MRTHDENNNRSLSSGDSASATKDVGTHKAVLLHEAIDILSLQEGFIVFDGTLGHGGHSKKIAEKIKDSGTLVATDLDKSAIDIAKKNLSFFKGNLIIENKSFSAIDEISEQNSIDKYNAILLDLGWNSEQVLTGKRGFSFLKDEPLIMRYDNKGQDEDLTAFDVVNMWSKDSLADIFYGFGGERFARKIASKIVEERQKAPIKTSKQLADIVTMAIPVRFRNSKIHSATKVFQAIRMVVNDELGELQRFLDKVLNYLTKDSILAIITFHSVEDRIVKRYFARWQKELIGKIITKKPIVASEIELLENKRARSAKLRAFKKLS